MKYKKQPGVVSALDLEDLSRTKETFVGPVAASRQAMQDSDAALNGDVVGLCAYSIAVGHTLREFAVLANMKINNTGGQ
jgi:hypothetical protein